MKRKTVIRNMQKIAVTLALSVLPVKALADVKINKTNFPDPAFRQWLQEQYYGQDGVLTEKEINGITQINVYNMGISSLQGIEFFTAMTGLNCGENQLTELDISKNMKLGNLYCNNNQLKALDISENTNLSYLLCEENELTKLDVSKNTELIQLRCFSNQLTELDVSKNTALKILYCENNQLTALDVSKNTALETLTCNNNQLTSLDVSKNTELVMLYCPDNQLTELDVTHNTALVRLRCFSNRLTALDVSKNTELKFLYCYENQLRGEAMDALIGSLPKQSGRLWVYFKDTDQYDMEPDGNVCTKANVEAATAKGWQVYYHNNDEWEEYEGAETDGVANVGMDQADAPLYDLSGRKLQGKPDQKGIYVKDGKKILYR